ncbi:MAG: lipopolysaccharide transport periplasmic protein LptA [Gallionella sp.]|nr:lipopolysaccharide transport periplasmic protein LptA [Gallionella sp.]
MRHARNSLLFLLSCTFYAQPALAERADRDKPMHIEAEQVFMDDARQVSTFTGDVQMIQGTMLIRGDKIIVTQDKEGFKIGTAYGKTASFRQKREGLDEYVEGYGERIVYDTQAETVDFYVRARVKRELDEVRGEHITYSQKTEIFQVNGGGTSNEGAPPKRVRAILQPKPKDGTEKAPSPDGVSITPSESLVPPEQ